MSNSVTELIASFAGTAAALTFWELVKQVGVRYARAYVPLVVATGLQALDRMLSSLIDEQAQELFNAIRREIYYRQVDGTVVVVGHEPVSLGKFLRAGIAHFGVKADAKPLPTQRQILQLAKKFFPEDVPWQVVPLVQRAFELWASSLQADPRGATIDPSGGHLPDTASIIPTNQQS